MHNTSSHSHYLTKKHTESTSDRAASLIRQLVPTDEWDGTMHNHSSHSHYLTKKHTESTSDLSSCFDNDNGSLDSRGSTSNDHRHIHMSSIPTQQQTLPTTNLHATITNNTIRTIIQNAAGIAIIRTSKLVLGFSIHFGSGILLSRTMDDDDDDDGVVNNNNNNTSSWSAPLAIGMYGGEGLLGGGSSSSSLQFGGLETVEYMIVLQTREVLDHFSQPQKSGRGGGGNYTIGGNNGDLTAPLLVYVISQGQYFGVSLEGSKLFTRDDINLRTYKHTSSSSSSSSTSSSKRREVTANDILTGRVTPPTAAEDLYAALHR